MITEIIQSTLVPVCANTFQLDASQDESMPFIVYNVKTKPSITKNGISSYTSELTIMCISGKISESVEIGNNAIRAIENATDGVNILYARFIERESDSGVVDGGAIYFNEQISFTIKHLNP